MCAFCLPTVEGALKTNYPRPEFIEEQIAQAIDAAAEITTRSAAPTVDKSKGYGTKQPGRKHKQKSAPKMNEEDQKKQGRKTERCGLSSFYHIKPRDLFFHATTEPFCKT